MDVIFVDDRNNVDTIEYCSISIIIIFFQVHRLCYQSKLAVIKQYKRRFITGFLDYKQFQENVHTYKSSH